MKNKYIQILSLYLNNRCFVILLGILLLSAFFSKLLFVFGFLYYAQEIFTILFIVSLAVAFYLGMLIKRQFAHHRAALLPNYRIPHIQVMLGVYLILILVAYLWEFGLWPVLDVSLKGLWGIYVTCLLLAIIITYLGYLSIGRILIYAYIILFIFSNQSMNLILKLSDSNFLVYLLFLGCVCFLGFFIHRLFRSNEEDVEFNYLLSWPPKMVITSQIQASQSVSDFLKPLSKIFGNKKNNIPINKYYKQSNIFSRSYHWLHIEHIDFKVIWIIMLLVTPLFLLIVNTQSFPDLYSRDVYSNFLLLTITPVLITLGGNYLRLTYWGYDVLKPVNKKEYMKQQGIVLFTSLMLYWTLFSICFVILPNIISLSDVLITRKFWIYLVLTLNISSSILGWLALLSCERNSISVIVQGAVLGLIILLCFYFVSAFSFQDMVLINLIFLIGNVLFCRKAYVAWSENEFDIS